MKLNESSSLRNAGLDPADFEMNRSLCLPVMNPLQFSKTAVRILALFLIYEGVECGLQNDVNFQLTLGIDTDDYFASISQESLGAN